MDQDKAQQSIDTLSEKVNGVVRSVRVSCSPENDYRGEKDYRSVFGVQEIECLYVDTEVLNKQFEGEPWEGKMTVRLFRLENGKGQCLSVKESGIKVERQDALPVYEEWIDRADLPEQAWKQGIYRILADIDGVAGQSEDLYIVPGEGKPEKYFRILHAGLDRFCEETESEAQKRPHSFRMFDATRLKNIRFFLMAQNLLGGEWVYEFVIRVVDRRGSIKAMQIVKSAQYIKDQAGNSILCFAVDLGNQEDFVTPGEYTVMVSCFGQTVLKMGYGIGHKDIPYDFDTFFASKTECESVVVNCETGKAEYKGNFKTKDEFLKCQMASCSVPFICEPVEIDGYHYLDGSIIDSIPVERAVEKGCDKIVVVLTKPEGSKPTDYSKIKKLIEWSYKKYPELCEVMAHRRQAYDRQDKFMKKLVEEGKVFVIRPEEQMIRHFENNNEKLLQCYQYGYDTMRKQFKAFEKFMEDKSSPR